MHKRRQTISMNKVVLQNKLFNGFDSFTPSKTNFPVTNKNNKTKPLDDKEIHNDKDLNKVIDKIMIKKNSRVISMDFIPTKQSKHMNSSFYPHESATRISP